MKTIKKKERERDRMMYDESTMKLLPSGGHCTQTEKRR